MFKRFFLSTLPLAILFSACIVPVEFNLDIFINVDGSYYYTYKGTIIDFDILYDRETFGQIDDESWYEDRILGLKETGDQYYSKIEYKGNGIGYVEFTSEKINNLLLIGFLGNRSSFGYIETINNNIILTIDNSYYEELNAEMQRYGVNSIGNITIHSNIPIKEMFLPNDATQIINKDTTIVQFTLTKIPENEIVISFAK